MYIKRSEGTGPMMLQQPLDTLEGANSCEDVDFIHFQKDI